MRLTGPVEHAIYAAAFVRHLEIEMTEREERTDPLTTRAASTAALVAERVVVLHREAMRMRIR